jgi:hypothetical protein
MPSFRIQLRPNGVVMFGSGARAVARMERRDALDLERVAIAEEAELRRLIEGRLERSRFHRQSRRRRIADRAELWS